MFDDLLPEERETLLEHIRTFLVDGGYYDEEDLEEMSESDLFTIYRDYQEEDPDYDTLFSDDSEYEDDQSYDDDDETYEDDDDENE